MTTWKACFGSEEEARCPELEQRLHAFYSSGGDYDAYREANWKTEFWAPVRMAIERCLSRSRASCSVLEVGAGRTGFASYLGNMRERVTYHVQDITKRNIGHLNQIADKVWICEITQIRQPYDVIFSTFVFEHLTAPKAALDRMLKLLRPSGSLFIASPRYDFPGYLSPSVRHLPRSRQVAIAVGLAMRRARVVAGGRPLFLLHYDPAVFHCPWHPDADAVHWPSIWDLKRFLRERGDGAVMRPMRLPVKGLRNSFWARFLLLFVEIRSQRESGCEASRRSEAAG